MSDPLVVIDFRERTLEVLGERLIVASAMYDMTRGLAYAHFSIPAGENRWWVNTGFCLEADDADCYVELCGGPFNGWGSEPDDILIAIMEAAMRQDAPPLAEHETMCCGMEFGSWAMFPEDLERWEWPSD